MQFVERLRWDLLRFGVIPPRAVISFSKARPLLVNSFPKSGTHLLESLLCRSAGYHRPLAPTYNPRIHKTSALCNALGRLQAGQVLFSHFPFDKVIVDAARMNNVGIIFVYRDPRDIVISNAHFIPTLPKHVHYKELETLTLENRLDILINGSKDLNVPSIFDRFDPFIPWLGHADLCLRFEALSRNSAAEERDSALMSLWNIAGIPPPGVVAAKSGSTTLRKGISGEWVDVLTPEQVARFQASDVLQQLGYE